MKFALGAGLVLTTVCGLLAVALPAQADEKDEKTEAQKTEAQKTVAEICGWIQQLGDPKRRERAASRLERKGAAAVEPLVEAVTKDGLEKNDKTLRALKILEDLGPVAKEAYAPLADALGQCDSSLFVPMWHTLGSLVPFADDINGRTEAQRLIQGAIQALQGMPAEDRRNWSAVYQRFTLRAQVDAKGGLKSLIREVESGAKHRREVAAEVLGRMGKAAKEALPALAAGLRGGTKKKTGIALQRGRGMVLRTSVGSLRNDAFEVRASEAMIRIAPGDPLCAPAYSWQLKHAKDPGVRSRSALQIGSFGKSAAKEVPALIKGLADKEPRVRWEVITALGMLGSVAEKAVPHLEKLAKGDDKAAAARAKASLKQIRRK